MSGELRLDAASVDVLLRLEGEIDAAILDGDRERAEAALRAWRGRWRDVIEEAAR